MAWDSSFFPGLFYAVAGYNVLLTLFAFTIIYYILLAYNKLPTDRPKRTTTFLLCCASLK